MSLYEKISPTGSWMNIRLHIVIAFEKYVLLIKSVGLYGITDKLTQINIVI